MQAHSRSKQSFNATEPSSLIPKPSLTHSLNNTHKQLCFCCTSHRYKTDTNGSPRLIIPFLVPSPLPLDSSFLINHFISSAILVSSRDSNPQHGASFPPLRTIFQHLPARYTPRMGFPGLGGPEASFSFPFLQGAGTQAGRELAVGQLALRSRCATNRFASEPTWNGVR